MVKGFSSRAVETVCQTACSAAHAENCSAAPGEKVALLSHQGMAEYATV